MNSEVTPNEFARAQVFDVRVVDLSLGSKRDILQVTSDSDHSRRFRGQMSFANFDEDDLEESPLNTPHEFYARTINVTLQTDKTNSPKGFRIEIAVRKIFLPDCPNALQERIDVRNSSGVLLYPPNSGHQNENCLCKTWIVSQPAGPLQNSVCAVVALPMSTVSL